MRGVAVRGVAVRGVAVLAVAAASLLQAIPATGAAARSRPFSGFGATLAAWRAAHPIDAGECAQTTCYGPLVAGRPGTYEFSYLTFAKGRVVGYDQALRRGTPLLQAELQVAELFPADATTSEITVVRHDQYGASCAVYDLQSKQLTRLFGHRAFGDDGSNVGVELATLAPNGLTTYNPRAIDLVIVMPTYADRNTNC
ncbi:MAG: hypothetical protein JWO62_3304 [Acidimicrobiaceae bacterium]|nr:hypothetical protein [Acidimicrobiaceae bacterium]